MSVSAVSNVSATAVVDDPTEVDPQQPQAVAQPPRQPPRAHTEDQQPPRFSPSGKLADDGRAPLGGPPARTVQAGAGPANSQLAGPTPGVGAQFDAGGTPDAAASQPGAVRTPRSVSSDAPAASASTGMAASATSANAPAANPPGPNSAELTGLLTRYEPQTSDTPNIEKMEGLQQAALRGAPVGAAQFESAQLSVSSKIGELPQKEQDYYRGAQAGFVQQFEAADTKQQRDAIATQFGSFAKTLDQVHSQSSNDPSQRAERFFGKPYGSQFLDEGGQTKAGQLERYRNEFNSAKDESGRGTAFANAAALKSDLQQQIGNSVGQSTAKVQADWQKSQQTVLDGLSAASALQGSTDANNSTAFTRLETFGNKVFTSESNARAFKAMQQEQPEKFAELGKWENEAAEKTRWAQKAIESDPFQRKMTVADVPKGYLGVDENKVPLARYGDALLTNYQNALKDVSNAGDLYHAAHEPGPIKQDYIREHTPPKPEWQQTADEVMCRIGVGVMPGVNMLTNQICPRSKMSEDARKGVDIVSGLLGGAAAGVGGQVVSEAASEAAGTAAGKAGGKIGQAISDVASGAGQKVAAKGGRFPARSETEGAATGPSTSATAPSVNVPAVGKTEGTRSKELGGDTRTSGSEDGTGAPRTSAPALPQTPAGSLRDIPQNYVQAQPNAIWNSERAPGLMEDKQGNMYAVDGKNVYAVKQDADNATWRVYNPRDTSRPAYPIRPNEDGGWQLHGNVGLKGGMLGEGDAVAGPSHGQAAAGAAQGRSTEQIVKDWVNDQDKKYKSITQTYDPGQLNLKAYEHKQVMVSDEVFKTLTDTQKINEQINTLLPYGSGNQHWDVQNTQGESVKRVAVGQALAAKPEIGLSRGLISACVAGAGNCSEMASLALQLAGDKFKTSPVMRVMETDAAGQYVDHTYVMVGDPRDPHYGRSSVVVDPWPSFPTAHTLGAGGERPFGPLEVSRHDPVDLGLANPEPLSTEAIDQTYRDLYGKPTDSNSVLFDIYNRDGERKYIWAQRTSGNDMSTQYISPSNPGGITLDKLPDYIVERYDPFIKRNDDYRGPLFPAVTNEQEDMDWAHFLAAGNIGNLNLSQEQLNALAAYFPQPHQ